MMLHRTLRNPIPFTVCGKIMQKLFFNYFSYICIPIFESKELFFFSHVVAPGENSYNS